MQSMMLYGRTPTEIKMAVDLEAKRWRAVFEEWILPESHKATRLANNPRGPFTVEVFIDTRRERPDWRVVLIPTRQILSTRGFATVDEAKSFVVGKFGKMIESWREV